MGVSVDFYVGNFSGDFYFCFFEQYLFPESFSFYWGDAGVFSLFIKWQRKLGRRLMCFFQFWSKTTLCRLSVTRSRQFPLAVCRHRGNELQCIENKGEICAKCAKPAAGATNASGYCFSPPSVSGTGPAGPIDAGTSRSLEC